MGNQFKVGDVVKLKSGGPNMTVTIAQPGAQIYCTWFHENKLERHAFIPETVEGVEADSRQTAQAQTDYDPFK